MPNFPTHRMLSDFRAFHLKEFGELFAQVVRLVREMDLVKLDTIAVDGTKVNATGRLARLLRTPVQAAPRPMRSQRRARRA